MVSANLLDNLEFIFSDDRTNLESNKMPDTKTPIPVIVGISQVNQDEDDFTKCREPLELMIEAVKAAAIDSEAPDILEKLDQVCVNQGTWNYSDPARAVASAVGAYRAKSARTFWGGNFVQFALNRMALAISQGELESVAFTGAEWGRTLARMRRKGHAPALADAPGEPDSLYGKHDFIAHLLEREIGCVQPVQTYPMFENALRYARGESPDEHLVRISELWARFAQVAANNPHAAIRASPSAEAIRTPSAGNRPVSFPYLKLLNSNNNVDQAAALILCSTEFAAKLGIPEEKWVYPLAGTDANDILFMSNRLDYTASPAIRIAGGKCLELAGFDTASLDFVDLYSCFPVAVQIAAKELGLDEEQDLTVTGGLTFAGGPLNNYVMHSVARTVELLRQSPEKKALVTANGGTLGKHAFTAYSGEPPEQPFRHASMQAAVDALPKREVLEEWNGRLAVETYTVMYGADGPEIGYATCLTPDGRRVWATTREAEHLDAMLDGEFCGTEIGIRGREMVM